MPADESMGTAEHSSDADHSSRCWAQFMWSFVCCRQPADETAQELLDMVERLRQSIVGVLEAGARRSTASSEMQTAQAHLVRQGVCGVTSHAMLSGSVQLVSVASTSLSDQFLVHVMLSSSFAMFPGVSWEAMLSGCAQVWVLSHCYHGLLAYCDCQRVAAGGGVGAWATPVDGYLSMPCCLTRLSF